MYMDKLAVGPALKHVVDIRNTVAENIHSIARELKKDLREVRCVSTTYTRTTRTSFYFI